jgi:hypothetical protein
MILKLAALSMLPMLMVGGVVMNSSILIVDVQEAGGTHIMVPVPLALAQMALAFAPQEIKYLGMDGTGPMSHMVDSGDMEEFRRMGGFAEIGEYWPYLERMVDELNVMPDGILVEVVDRNDHVIVAKEGEYIRVSVDEGKAAGETVNVNIPLATITAMLDAYDQEGGYIRTSRLVSAMRAAPSGELVRVNDGGDKVSIRMW